MEKFIDIKNRFKDLNAFIAWASEQEFSQMHKGNTSMYYADLKLGNREIQERTYNFYPLPAKPTLGHIFFSPQIETEFFTWESVFGKDRAEQMAKKYNARIMEAPYCETEGQEIEFILKFENFDKCLEFMWDTAEQYNKFHDLFIEYTNTKPLQELYEMSLT